MVTHTPLAIQDDHGTGQLAVCLPGAGDLQSEFRLMTRHLEGMRVVTADLPGHGESPPAPSYGVAETAGSLIDLIDSLDAGPAVVIACSFAPAAAIWAAAEAPDRFAGIVAISPHLETDGSLKGRLQTLAISALLRGPVAGPIWAALYKGWYKAVKPADLDQEVDKLKAMMGRPHARRAVRETLTASREGLPSRIERLRVPTLTVFGSADDHFPDPAGECTSTADRLGGDRLLVEGAGHYPHVEQPEAVAGAITAFVGGLDTWRGRD